MVGGEDGEHNEDFEERPFGVRPFGVRPFGVRPFGVRPFGVRPFGVRLEDERPFGVKPFGVKPFGVKPFGVRPFGTKPFGVRPFGVRPFGVRPFGVRLGDIEVGALDAEEWTADIAVLLCERSAVIRLGATVVAGDHEVHIPLVDATADAPGYVDEGAPKPELESGRQILRPREHELAAKVVVPDSVARDIARDPALAEAVKEDLADALALRLDQVALAGVAPLPVGISQLVPSVPAANAILVIARAMLTEIRTVDPLLNPAFRAPGWIVHPETLDVLSKDLVTGANTVDMFTGLLKLEGADTGRLLGYPFVVSAAASVEDERALFFSADWREAWIATDGALVDVSVSTDAHFQTDETAFRATIRHDFALRRPAAFTWGPGRAKTSARSARRRK